MCVSNVVDFQVFHSQTKTNEIPKPEAFIENAKLMGFADMLEEAEGKLAKLKTTTPAEVHKYIATASRNCKQYKELVQLAEAQLSDPLAGPSER